MIKKLIAHQISKDAHSNETIVLKRDAVLPVTAELSEKLFSQLRSSFRSHNPVVGKFREVGNTVAPFRQIMLDYIDNSQQEDADFVNVSSRAMDLLQVEMSRQSLATGGYVVFVQYEAGGGDFLQVALLSIKAQPTFDKNLNLVAAITPNLTDLRHSVRIRTNDVRSNGDGVVQFVSQRGPRVSDYFVDFLGCEEITNTETQGRILYTVLNAWAAQNGFTDEQKLEMFGRAYAHWKECRKNKRPITLTGLANILEPEDPTAILTHLTAEDSNLSGEFPAPAPSTMKRFVRFVFNAKGIRIEYDKDEWENDVVISEQNRTLTIKNIPDELIAAYNHENE